MGCQMLAQSRRFLFGRKSIDELKAPSKGFATYYDTRQPGLCVLVTKTGHKSFYLYKKVDRRPVRIKLGACAEISVEVARNLAQQHAGAIAKGENPHEARQDRRSEPTLQALFNAWLESYGKVHKRERSWREDERVFNTLATSLRSRRLGAVDATLIRKWHTKIGAEHGKYAANRALALLSSLFNESRDLVGWNGASPTKDVKRFAEMARERFLQPDEVRKLFAALDEAGEPWRDYFRLALFTGARRGNLTAMRWDEISIPDRIWTISGDNAKGGRAIVIALAPEAMDILKRRVARSNGSPWVFPSSGKTGHLIEIKSGWQQIVRAAGLPDLRPHDLRRTLGSWQAAQGASLAIIGKSLGHAPGSPATTVYARLTLAPVRQAVEQATAALTEAAGGGANKRRKGARRG